MKVFRSLTTSIIAFPMLLQAQVQNRTTPDPYRNFVGHWTGVVKVNPNHMPTEIELTITESKDGKKMLWSYVFGTKGQKGYEKAIRTVLLQPAKQEMTSKWQDQDTVRFTTTGLDEFARAGYGKFIGLVLTEHGDTPLQDAVTIELQPSTLSYTWTSTKSGVTNIYSYFDFQRTPLPSDKTP